MCEALEVILNFSISINHVFLMFQFSMENLLGLHSDWFTLGSGWTLRIHHALETNASKTISGKYHLTRLTIRNPGNFTSFIDQTFWVAFVTCGYF